MSSQTQLIPTNVQQLYAHYSKMPAQRVVWDIFAKRPELRALIRFILENRDLEAEKMAQKYFAYTLAGYATEAITNQLPEMAQPVIQFSASAAEMVCLVHLTEKQFAKVLDTINDFRDAYHNDLPREKLNSEQRFEKMMDKGVGMMVETIVLGVYILDVVAFLNNPKDPKMIQNAPQNFCQILDCMEQKKTPRTIAFLGNDALSQYTTSMETLQPVHQNLNSMRESFHNVNETIERTIGDGNGRRAVNMVKTCASTWVDITKRFFLS